MVFLTDLHEKGIVHRDLKPENILIGLDLHIRVIDFGDACYLDDEKNEPFKNLHNDPYENLSDEENDGNFFDMGTFEEGGQNAEKNVEKPIRKGSFVGSPLYVSPEMLNQNFAGSEADFWALGAIIFTLLYGRNPFNADTEHLVFEKIVNLDFEFPQDAQPDEIDLIKNLLQLNP